MRIHLIRGYSNSYIIEKSNEIYVVDVGMNPKAKEIIRKIEEINKPLKYILITHEHIDHIRGLKSLKENFPEAKVVAHKNSEDYLKGKKILLPKSFIYRFLSFFIRINGVDLDIKVSKEENIKDIKIVFTPGHTKNSLSFLIDKNLFVGDLLVRDKSGKLTFPPSKFNDNEKEMIKSLKKLYKYDFKSLYLGHGTPIEKNGKKVLKKFLENEWK